LHPANEAVGRGRLLVTAIIAAGGVLLTGCTSGEAQSGASDARPTIDELARPTKYPATSILDTAPLSAAVGRGIASKKMPDYSLYADGIGNFPGDHSVPLFDVVLGNDGKLHYEDQANGIVALSQEKVLFNAVYTSEELVAGLMKAQKLHSVRFRLYEQKDSTERKQVPSFPLFAANDPADQGHSNIYTFLPPNALLDEKGLTAGLTHELTHNTLQHSMPSGALNESDKQIVDQACQTLTHAALQEIKHSAGSIINQLFSLRDKADKRFQGSFDIVIAAIQNGTYDSLPKESGNMEVSSCYIQAPLVAVTKVAASKGIEGSFVDKNPDEFSHIASIIMDDWQALLNEMSVYRYLREAAYIPPSINTKTLGHPQDDSKETTCTFANIAFSFPEEVADHVTYDLTPTEKKAFNDIVAFDVAHIRKLYAKFPDMLKTVNARYDAYLAALAAA
jgi:hypothetical protein